MSISTRISDPVMVSTEFSVSDSVVDNGITLESLFEFNGHGCWTRHLHSKLTETCAFATCLVKVRFLPQITFDKASGPGIIK